MKATIRKPVVLLVILFVIVLALLTAVLMVILTNGIIADSAANYVYQAQIKDFEQVKVELQSQMQTRLT